MWYKSVGLCLFNLRTEVGGVVNAVMRVLWWPTSRWWKGRDSLLISVATNGMCKSVCRVKLETYQGASVMDRRIFYCSRWMICVWDGFAQPHSWMPYVHTGLSTHLYKRSLFSRDSLDLRPRSQYMLRNFRFKWRRFILIRVRQVRRWSRCNPRYLTSNCSSIPTMIATGSSKVWQIPEAVRTVQTPDDGWRFHPKHVER
jgi:hypothetical protein